MRSVDHLDNLRRIDQRRNQILNINQRPLEDISLSSKFVYDIEQAANANFSKNDMNINNNSTFMKLETESENGQTPVKSKITNLEKQTKQKIVFNTIDEMSNNNRLSFRNGFENHTFENQFQWDENEPDKSELSFDDAADIDDSVCIDEAPVSQKSIN